MQCNIHNSDSFVYQLNFTSYTVLTAVKNTINIHYNNIDVKFQVTQDIGVLRLLLGCKCSAQVDHLILSTPFPCITTSEVVTQVQQLLPVHWFSKRVNNELLFSCLSNCIMFPSEGSYNIFMHIIILYILFSILLVFIIIHIIIITNGYFKHRFLNKKRIQHNVLVYDDIQHNASNKRNFFK